MDKWIPSQKQKSGLISRTFEFFINELAELQDELDCPDEYICDFIEAVKILGIQMVVIQRHGSIKEIIQVPTENAR